MKFSSPGWSRLRRFLDVDRLFRLSQVGSEDAEETVGSSVNIDC